MVLMLQLARDLVMSAPAQQGKTSPALEKKSQGHQIEAGSQVGVRERHAVERLARKTGPHRHRQKHGEGADRAIPSARPNRDPEDRRIGQGDRNDIKREVRERHPVGCGQESGKKAIEDRRELIAGGHEGVARVERTVDEAFQDRHGDPVVAVAEAISDHGQTGERGQGGGGGSLKPGQRPGLRAFRFV